MMMMMMMMICEVTVGLLAVAKGGDVLWLGT